jgi:hypothetical protein
MPDVHASATINIPLFIDKTILPHELVALLGAHTTAKQFFVSQRGLKELRKRSLLV